MASLSSLKPFAPLLFTFVLPRVINYYRTIKTAVRTRPPSQPLPRETARGLNVLFVSICIFLFWTVPLRSYSADQNVFSVTNSRLHIPTDVLFARLALLRPQGLLNRSDEELRAKITTPVMRQLYLRFGPKTILNCSFCVPEDDASYLLYHLPSNVILPHLVHLLALGLATSGPVAGLEASRWRTGCSFGALAFAALDVYLTSMYGPPIDGNMPAPSGLFWQARTLRPLLLCIFDIAVAFCIYARATKRFILFSSPDNNDPEIARRQQEQILSQTNVALQMAQTKLRAFTVARNATVREPRLKAADDEYWRAVVAMEGPPGAEGIWEDEEVQSAIARSYGSGTVDIARMRKEADAFITNVTRGLSEHV